MDITTSASYRSLSITLTLLHNFYIMIIVSMFNHCCLVSIATLRFYHSSQGAQFSNSYPTEGSYF